VLDIKRLPDIPEAPARQLAVSLEAFRRRIRLVRPPTFSDEGAAACLKRFNLYHDPAVRTAPVLADAGTN
jgi:hypothetical protein